ncbi:hypothetical protein JB92DRAFT_3153435 [Gautieria morchelliformis]|nr:hypothetical protein JB92DRAFT_3153435 [Gautieria morchelliformis]
MLRGIKLVVPIDSLTSTRFYFNVRSVTNCWPQHLKLNAKQLKFFLSASGAGGLSIPEIQVMRATTFQQQSQNPSLKKGSEILKKTQALRKLSKMDSIGIKLTIWYYPAVRLKGGFAHNHGKIQIPAVVEGFTATTLATEMIDRLLKHAERDKVVFAVAKTVHESSYLDIDEPNLFCTVQALHEKLEKNSLLLDKDIKGKCITMQLRLYEVKSDIVDAETLKTDEDIECDSRPIPPFHMRSVAHSSKRKLSSRSHVEEPLPSAKHYPFNCKTYVVNVDREVTEKEDSIYIKTILIPKNWRRYVNTGKKEQGYLGYGYAKFAFMGRVASDSFAVLQSKNLNSDTEYLNKYDIKCKLKLLTWGKFFLNSFIRCAHQYGAKNIPGNGDTGENSDYLGIWIDAFAHHTVVDSMGEYVFVDIQGFVYSENRVILFDPQAHT